MSIDNLTFFYYINTTRNENVNKFLRVFENSIYKIPKNMSSSKKIIDALDIDYHNREDFNLFRIVYMEYFIQKVKN